MANQHTAPILDFAQVLRLYNNGEAAMGIAARFGVSPRRIRRLLHEHRVPIRTSWNHLVGNTHRKRADLPRADLYKFYVTDELSIAAIEELTARRNIRDQLIRANIPRRGYAQTRVGKGDNCTPEGRERVTASHRGPRSVWYRDGRSARGYKFYQTPTWKRLARTCKDRDHLTCTDCGVVADLPYLRAHHMVARNNGGADTLDNLRTVCVPCHARLHTIDHILK